MSCNGSCNCTQEADFDGRIKQVKEILEKYKFVRGGLIPVLHETQELYGYLPENVLKVVSEGMKIPMQEIYGVATFYHLFSLKPKGEHVIRVCMGTACYVKGAKNILDTLSQELNVEVGKTTSDGRFTLEATRCLGACGLSPVMTIDDKVFGKVNQNNVRKILNEFLAVEEEAV